MPAEKATPKKIKMAVKSTLLFFCVGECDGIDRPVLLGTDTEGVQGSLQLVKSMLILIWRVPAAISTSTFMKTLFTRAATTNQTLVKFIYSTYAVCLPERYFLFLIHFVLSPLLSRKTNFFFFRFLFFWFPVYYSKLFFPKRLLK